MRNRIATGVLAAAVIAASAGLAVAGPTSTAFTYQGKLDQGGVAFEGSVDLQCSLFDAATGGAQVGATQTILGVDVSNGLFTTPVDFGAAAFNGEQRWIEFAVRSPAGSGSYVPLTGRQAISVAPYAAYSLGPWQTSGTSLLYPGGRVGIGVASPGAQLAVGTSDPYVLALTSGDSIGARLRLSSAAAGGRAFEFIATANGNTNGAGRLLLADSVGPRLTIADTGNIGIGTTAPAARLAVTSSDQYALQLSSPDTQGTRVRLNSTATGGRTFDWLTTADGNSFGGGKCMLVDAAAGSRLTVDATGQVGIGTTAPVDRLTVQGTGTALSAIDGAVRTRFFSAASTGRGYIGTSTNNGLMLRTGDVDRVLIDTSGRVGINVVPVAQFAVQGADQYVCTLTSQDTVGTRLRLISNTTGGGTWDMISTGPGNTFGPGNWMLADPAVGPRMLMDDTGRLGVGVTNPAATVHATNVGDVVTTGLFTTSALTGTALWGNAMNANGANRGILGSCNSAVGTAIEAVNNNTVAPAVALRATTQSSTGYAAVFSGRMTVTGWSGLGRLPVANMLEVEGNASKTTAGSWLANSDARIKTDVMTLRGALDTLDKVRLVSFGYEPFYKAAHPSVGNRRHFNVIAQEFAQVFPDYVQLSGERLPGGEPIMQVDTYPLTIYSAAAVQELHGITRTQEASIAALSAENRELKAQITQLSKRLSRLEMQR